MDTPSIPTAALRVAVALSGIVALASLSLHIASLFGLTLPFTAQWVGMGCALGAFAPILIAVIRRAEDEIGPADAPAGGRPNVFDAISKGSEMNRWLLRLLPTRERIVFGLLLVYAGIWMVLGFAEIVTTPDLDGFPLPMLSGLWLYLSGVGVLYGRRLIALRSTPAPTDTPARHAA